MNNTTGKDLIAHWEWAAEKGLMNANTAMAWKAASFQVLSTLGDDWENQDITSLDVEDALNRFQNLRSTDFRPTTLNAYKRRFRLSVKSFLEHRKNPSGWKAPAQDHPQKGKNGGKKKQQDDGKSEKPAGNTPPEEGLFVFPYPLRENLVVYLHLPPDLKTIEVKRLTAFMTTLTVDFELNQ